MKNEITKQALNEAYPKTPKNFKLKSFLAFTSFYGLMCIIVFGSFYLIGDNFGAPDNNKYLLLVIVVALSVVFCSLGYFVTVKKELSVIPKFVRVWFSIEQFHIGYTKYIDMRWEYSMQQLYLDLKEKYAPDEKNKTK